MCSTLKFQVFFGTMQARNMLSAVALGINCSTGMSSMVRKEIVEKAGGLQHFGQYLAEDFFLARESVMQYVYIQPFSASCDLCDEF